MQGRHASVGFTFREILVVSLLGMIAIAKWGVHSGQDLGPDLVNYHFYNAYLAFHKDRLLTDILPAGIQGFLNPYLYVLPYVLYKVLAPKTVGLLIGALHGLCFISAYVVSRLLLANWSLWSARLMAFACAAFGVANPFFIAMIGSTFSDNLTPPLLLVPLALIMSVRFPMQPLQSDRRFYYALIFSGLLMGMAVGFKLCNCAFVFGAAAAWLVNIRVSRNDILLLSLNLSRRDILGGMALCAGVVVGFLSVNGEWMWRLYTEFQSPMFPFYNQIFKSPMIKVIDTNVPAWAAAHSFYDFLIYPYNWAVGIPPQSEWEFTDARYAVIYTLIAGLLVLNVFRPVKMAVSRLVNMIYRFKRDETEPCYVSHRQKFLLMWAAVSYIFWIDQFGALRYLMPLTLLTGIITWICLYKLIPHRKIAIVLWLAIVITTLATMKAPYFGRVKWKDSWYPVHVPEQLMASRNTLYLKNTLSFVIPFFPEDANFISIGYLVLEGNLINKGNEMIAAHQGPIRTLTLVPMADSSFYDQIEKLGLRYDPRDCVAFKAGVYPFLSCSLNRVTKNQQPIMMPLLPTPHSLIVPQSPWIKQLKGFYYPEETGAWTQGKVAEIEFFGSLPRKFKLKLSAQYILGDNDKLPIKIEIGRQVKQVVFGSGVMTAETTFNLKSSNVRKIIIRIPKPVSPHALNAKSEDTRELGLMLKSIAIT